MEIFLDHIFKDELRIETEHTGVFLTDIPRNPKASREKMAQVMFEHFRVPHFYVGHQPTLALYATNRTTGLSVASGGGVTNCVPVYEGFSLAHAQLSMDLAGQDVTDYLRSLMVGNPDYPWSHTVDLQEIDDIKRHFCYVAADPERELLNASSWKTRSYTLEDDREVEIGKGIVRFVGPGHRFNITLTRSV